MTYKLLTVLFGLTHSGFSAFGQSVNTYISLSTSSGNQMRDFVPNSSGGTALFVLGHAILDSSMNVTASHYHMDSIGIGYSLAGLSMDNGYCYYIGATNSNEMSLLKTDEAGNIISAYY
ncbi:MAG TPA: hypothetical protein VK476_06450, partial [Flavobacterium sp.]|nr:hypothetical protein [Flavobacterium sp.]